MSNKWYQKNQNLIKRGAKIALYGSWLIAVVIFFDHFFRFPLLTAVLGPTAYIFAAHPESETARIRNAVIGHSCAVGVGLLSIAIFQAANTSTSLNVLYLSWYQLFTVVGALFVTLFLLEVLNSHHAPAAGTVILISAGLASSGEELIGLIVGLVSIISMAALMHYFFPYYKGSHQDRSSSSIERNHL